PTSPANGRGAALSPGRRSGRCATLRGVRAAAPPAPGVRERKKARTRQAIIDAALDLFSRRGFDATTVEEIARPRQVPPRTSFRSFPTKDDALFAEEPRLPSTLAPRILAQPRELPSAAALHRALRAVTLDYASDRERLQAKKLVIETSTGLRAFRSQYRLLRHDVILETLQARQGASGCSLSPFELRLLIDTSTAAVQAALASWLGDETDSDLGVLIDIALDRLARGLSPTGP